MTDPLAAERAVAAQGRRIAGPTPMTATAELTVIGLGSSDPAAGGFLAAIRARLAAQRKVSASVRGMSASLEGPLEDIFELAAELHRIPLELGMLTVVTVLTVEQQAGGHGAPRPGTATDGRSFNGGAPAASLAIFGPAAVAPTEPRASRAGAHPAPTSGGRGDTIVHAVAAGLVDSSPTTVTAPVLAPVTVRVAGVTKTYGEGATSVEALKGIDLEIRRGEFVAVMGPSGSGKSTLMHILGALEAPTSGTVEIGGVSYAGLDDKAQTQLRRDRIGFVFQFFNLLRTLNAEENVMLPSLIAGEPASELRERAEELLDLVGLGARRDHLPSQLSGGEQQRVSIARALMRNPRMLLADEPTGNLDSRNSAVVLDLLGRLSAESNHTVTMVTHDPVAASRATRVVFLRDGLMAGEVPGGDRHRVVEFFSALSAQATD